MQATKIKNLDKIYVMDPVTFAQIRQQVSNASGFNSPVRKFRNAKYKRKHQNAGNDVDLLALIATSNLRKKGTKARTQHHKKGATLLQQQTRPNKKGGKVRENRHKRLTRIKKSILKSRELRLSRSCPMTENECNRREVFSGNGQEIPKDNIPFASEIQDLNTAASAYEEQPNMVNYINSNKQHLTGLIVEITDQMRKISVQDSMPKPYKNAIIHSRRFREYCENCTTSDLAELCSGLLADLNRFQMRAYQKNPIKANAHRRIVIGFREVQNNLRVNKIKLVLIATDCEKCNIEGGIDDQIQTIKAECKSLGVPYAFPLPRRKLAYALKKNGNVSCVGILDYDGARDKFFKLLQSLENARAKYIAAITGTQ